MERKGPPWKIEISFFTLFLIFLFSSINLSIFIPALLTACALILNIFPISTFVNPVYRLIKYIATCFSTDLFVVMIMFATPGSDLLCFLFVFPEVFHKLFE